MDVKTEKIIQQQFPYKKPRPGQLEIISHINKAIQDGYEYIILEAGTGTGKSAIATTLARMHKSTYILTMTKQLQKQYETDFGFATIKGRSNYTCTHNPDLSCDNGECKPPTQPDFDCQYGITTTKYDKTEQIHNNEAFTSSYNKKYYYKSDTECDYWYDKSFAINRQTTIMNYDYFIPELNYIKHFSPRNLLVLDEAHNIENKLMNIVGVKLNKKRIWEDIRTKINNITDEDVTKYETTLTEIINKYKKLLKKICEESQMFLSEKEIKQKRKTVTRINNIISNIVDVLHYIDHEPENWVVTDDKYNLIFKPLQIHNYTKKMLFNYADVCLFMSATILDKNNFCKWLGLDAKEVKHIKVKSPFNKNSRSIKLDLVGKMSNSQIKKNAPKTIPKLEKILTDYTSEKGIIHTNSYKCSNYIQQKIKNKRLLFHNSYNREKVLEKYLKSKEPLVLVSPSMSEGVDLPYELCRFQVIYKIPFPYLGDKQIKNRMEKDRAWYAYKTVMSLMQTYGRGMRAEDDWCNTFVLDSNINFVLYSNQYKNFVSDFFKEAIKK
jgi:Rad3-related DNA helicase